MVDRVHCVDRLGEAAGSLEVAADLMDGLFDRGEEFLPCRIVKISFIPEVRTGGKEFPVSLVKCRDRCPLVCYGVDDVSLIARLCRGHLYKASYGIQRFPGGLCFTSRCQCECMGMFASFEPGREQFAAVCVDVQLRPYPWKDHGLVQWEYEELSVPFSVGFGHCCNPGILELVVSGRPGNSRDHQTFLSSVTRTSISSSSRVSIIRSISLERA
ncbi:MAG: hypothetical protein A4E38_01677 [Methanoregulaceae archaeon PtaB.Bin108]|nr:MAG: hypothetical protein A4E38_01677 [Methanoregulaceae archaeon PtaB.Bin108]